MSCNVSEPRLYLRSLTFPQYAFAEQYVLCGEFLMEIFSFWARRNKTFSNKVYRILEKSVFSTFIIKVFNRFIEFQLLFDFFGKLLSFQFFSTNYSEKSFWFFFVRNRKFSKTKSPIISKHKKSSKRTCLCFQKDGYAKIYVFWKKQREIYRRNRKLCLLRAGYLNFVSTKTCGLQTPKDFPSFCVSWTI